MAATDSGFSEGLPLVRPLDEEQARLVEILLAAGGSVVSFEELRAQGFENPAVLAYELEIAGLAITHVQRLRPGGRATSVGLRLDATLPLEVPSQEPAREREPLAGMPPGASEALAGGDGARPRVRRAGSAAPLGPRSGLLSALTAVVSAVALVVLVVTVMGGTGSPGKTHAKLPLAGSGAGRATSTSSASAAARRSAAGRTARRASHASRGKGSSEAQAPPLSRAARLQQAGHLLLAEGRYAAAIPELRAAISASGESARGCSEPSTPGCVAYAEALYDLGRALRLDNAPAAAGAILRERLRIDSQREAVRHELGLNRRRHASPPASRRPAHVRTRRGTAAPPPPAKHHPYTGGASAPVQTQPEAGTGPPTSPSAGSEGSSPGGSTAPQ